MHQHSKTGICGKNRHKGEYFIKEPLHFLNQTCSEEQHRNNLCKK